MTVTASPHVQARRGIRSTVDQEFRQVVSYEAEVRLRGPLQVLNPVLRPGDAP